MEQKRPLGSISDDELLRRLVELTRQSRRIESDLVAHIGEVDARRLYVREASPSMFAYCTETLHLSEAQAYLRIAAARASREYPILLVMLADGRLHLTGIAKLAPHLTRENLEGVLKRASHGSKRQIEELVAELAPQPDAPAVMRRLPAGRRTLQSRRVHSASAAPTGPMTSTPPSRLGYCAGSIRRLQPTSSPARDAVPSPFDLGLGQASATDPGTRPNSTAVNRLELRPDAVVASAAPKTPPALIQPLAPARYKVQFTASAELHGKLERLRALMRFEVPDGDLAAVIEAAVTLKLERLEARRFAAAKAPRTKPSAALSLEAPSSPSSRYIPAAVRRAVCERDENRCRYVNAEGRRCSARDRLEFHHRRPFGVGGDHGPANVSLLCRAHNDFMAEHDYGRAAMARWRSRPGTPEPEALPLE